MFELAVFPTVLCSVSSKPCVSVLIKLPEFLGNAASCAEACKRVYNNPGSSMWQCAARHTNTDITWNIVQ